MSAKLTLDDGAAWAGPEAAAELKDLRDEAEHYDDLIARQGALLRGVVNAIKGPPPDDTLWSHHDAPELAAGVMAELEALRADALRYRWLRDQLWDQEDTDLYALPITWRADEFIGNAGDNMDSAIDEARKGAA